MNKKKKDIELNNCYQEIFTKIMELQSKYDNQMIAGTMMAQALRLYKTNLTDVEFKAMVQIIAKSEDSIQPFNMTTIN